MSKQYRKSKKFPKVNEGSIEETVKHKLSKTRRKGKYSIDKSERDNSNEINGEFDEELEERDSEYEFEQTIF